jgi:hypothetical protein
MEERPDEVSDALLELLRRDRTDAHDRGGLPGQ